MNDNATTELLIQYLDNELDDVQRTALEQRIASDIALQEELQSLRIASQAVKSYGLRQKVGSIHNEMMTELKQQRSVSNIAPVRKMTRYIARIAAILVIVLAGTAAYQYMSLTTDKVYNEVYSPYTATVSRGTETNNALEQAYLQNNFTEVTSLFEKIPRPSTEDYFFAGNAYLQQHVPVKSIRAFTALQKLNQQQGTHVFEEDAEFYLALAYLQNNEIDKAVPLLKNIHEDKHHSYHDKVSGWQIFKLEMLQKKEGNK